MKKIFFWNKIKQIILFQDLKCPREKKEKEKSILKKHSLNSTNNSKRLLDIFLKQTINIRELFHHFRIIWNYSNKRKTATLLWLPRFHAIPCYSPPPSPTAFFTATREGRRETFIPPLPLPLILVPFFLLAHLLAFSPATFYPCLPANSALRARESVKVPHVHATRRRRQRSKKQGKGRTERKDERSVIERGNQ